MKYRFDVFLFLIEFCDEVGGVGKTLLTASVVRDERVRAAFEVRSMKVYV